MKKTLTKIFFGLAAAGLLAACSGGAQDTAVQESTAQTSGSLKKIGITSIVDHPALDNVRQGVVDELAEQGYKDGENVLITFQSAQNNTATAGQIAKQFVGDKVDAIVAIATPSAQAAVAATDTIPVVFAAVSDPVTARLVPTWEASGTNVTGVSDMPTLESQIDLIRKVVPQVKAVGYVYSPGEVNSVIVMKNLQEQLGALGIKLEAAAAQRTTDITQAARSLQGKVDVIYTPLDNNVASAYESLYQTAVETQIPLVGADVETVSRGAVAAVGASYYDIGRETGKIVVRILRGERAGDIPSQTMKMLDLYISTDNARAQGVILSEELIARAVSVNGEKRQ